MPKNHVRHIMLHEFKNGNLTAEPDINTYSVYGKKCANERTFRRWSAKFRSGDFTLDDNDRSGRPVYLVIRFLKQLLKKMFYQLTNNKTEFKPYNCSSHL